MQRKALGIVLFCVVLTGAIVAGYWDMLNTERERADGELAAASAPDAGRPAAAPPAPAATDRKPATGEPSRQATPSPPAPENPQMAALPGAPGVPTFDVLRVEPNGDTVVAGRARPGAEVTLSDGRRTLGTDVASADGDFVVVLAQPLPPGSHQVRIGAKGPDGAVEVSEEEALISVPADGNPSGLLALVEKPNAASRIITVPTTEPAAPADREGTETAVAVPEAPSAPGGTSPAATAAAPAALRVEAVEIENGKVFVAGAAPKGSIVQIYVDGALVGATGILPSDRFLMTAQKDLPVGNHIVRADAVGPDGKVQFRAEVPFDRPAGTSVAAISPQDAAAAHGGDAAGEPTTQASAVSAPGAGADEAGVPTTRQAPLQASDPRVIIRRGDTLWRISRDTYGRGARYTVIYLANGEQIRDPDRIYPGQVFRLPKDEAAASNEAPTIN